MSVNYLRNVFKKFTCAIPVTEIGTPSRVYTLGESTFSVIVFKFNLENQHYGDQKPLHVHIKDYLP